MADPWFKFYPTDWRADPALRMCSPAARGVWIELICLMHEAQPYGHLLVNGQCPTDAQVAVLAGTLPDQLSQCLRELEEAGVFSRTRDGVIYSRKMTRSAKKAATARRNGRKGGNPRLGKETENPALDNLPDKVPDKPQKPEARSQSNIIDLDKSKSCAFDEFWKLWPDKKQKDTARKRWKRLSQADRDAALVAVRNGWFDKWRSDHRDANPIHASTFLSGKRWEDYEAQPSQQVSPEQIQSMLSSPVPAVREAARKMQEGRE